ncbi:hypothetical protein BSQ44_06280 [Aquibium oceanicum]|uniref:Transposase n=1 Tax=Aquibium oceanicum TaxID=1670800 RepID=A0A1L3SNP3_9HYPH|nr:hypothetical protein BSQ44_06280 [Aquibium oceanicum]
MSEDCQRVAVITSVARRRQWSTDAKLRIIEESFEPGEMVSSVARRNGVAPNHGAREPGIDAHGSAGLRPQAGAPDHAPGRPASGALQRPARRVASTEVVHINS